MNTDTKLYLNPHLFFLMRDGKMILWNCKAHQQYTLEQHYMDRLLEISDTQKIHNASPIDGELIAEGIVQQTPYPEEAWGWDNLSKLYHVGIQDIDGGEDNTLDVWVNEYLALSSSIEGQDGRTLFPKGDCVPLPTPKIQDLSSPSFLDVLQRRKTSRVFDGTPMTIEELSTLLFTSFGHFHGKWQELEDKGLKQLGYRRTSPSGGALHPVEVALFITNVTGISQGTYFYHSIDHTLIRIKDAPDEKTTQQALDGQFFAKGCAVMLVLIGHFSKVWTKYPHSRSYKDVYLDAGHVSQTCLLSATALNLQTWVTAWFRDRSLSDLLAISGMETAPLFVIGLGHGSGQAVPDVFGEEERF